MTDEYLALTNARTLESGTMERAVEFWVAIQLLIIGLSHLLQPRVWVDFMIRLRGWGHAGVFVNGMLSLSFGAVIVAGHHVWQGLPALITVLGCLHLVKATISLTCPQLSMRALERVSMERAWEISAAGGVFVGLSALCWYVIATQSV